MTGVSPDLPSNKQASYQHPENSEPFRAVAMTTRLQRLAEPKPNLLKNTDRRSVYWLDRLPPEDSVSITRPALSSRWLELCRPRRNFCTEVTGPAVRDVSVWALEAVPSSRILRLARPRGPTDDWTSDRLLGRPSRATQTAVASPRICRLARPKRRPEVLEVPKTKPRPLTSSKASAHIELLATPKVSRCAGGRSALWSVSAAATSHSAGPRLQELSGPRRRSALYEGHDPYAVSRAARCASPSPRIRQLSLPLPRKCRSQLER